VEIPIINPKKAIKILKQETFRILRDIIYANSGIFFPENKLYLLEGRLNKRLEEIGLDSFEDYVIYLKKGSVQAEELKKVYNLITINETYFFRHEKQLYAFEKKILPEVMELRKKEGKRNLRVWSAAASSGEESYTLAILMKETLNGQMGNWQVEITGTDISQKILAKAREGIFGKNSFRSNMVNYAQYQNKYFLPQGENLAVRDEIKKLVNFDFLNLNDVNAIRARKSVDFLFCRNVLIYFDMEVKKKIIRAFYDIMNHGSYLFLGEAESLHGISSAFKVEHFPGAFIYKKE